MFFIKAVPHNVVHIDRLVLKTGEIVEARDVVEFVQVKRNGTSGIVQVTVPAGVADSARRSLDEGREFELPVQPYISKTGVGFSYAA